MRAPLVVMSHPLCQDSAQVFLAQWNREIQTLPAYASHQSFAVGVGMSTQLRPMVMLKFDVSE
jgi:hypothetical protein